MSGIVADWMQLNAPKLLKMETELNRTDSWQMFNTGGVEVEVGEFLYGLARMTKPERILETGTHFGISTAFMAMALRENGFGKITTIEFMIANTNKARALSSALGLEAYVTFITDYVENFTPAVTFDMMLLDTEPRFRLGEMMRFWPNLNPGGVLIIHDCHPHMHQMDTDVNWAYGVMPQEIKDLMLSHELQSFHWRTPRGLYICQKTGPEFYTTRLLRGQV